MNYSRQRDLILKTLQENVIHPTADNIYEILKKMESGISLATVYRNLNLLADKGIIRRISGLDGITRFDHNTHKHYHFICSKCHKVYDVPYDIAPDLTAQAAERCGLIVESCEVSFKGICAECKKLTSN